MASGYKQGYLKTGLKFGLLSLAFLTVTGICVYAYITSQPEYWIAQLGRHYIPNEIFGRSPREPAASNLKRMGAEKVVPAAAKMLSSGDWWKRAGAADALSLFASEAQPATGELIAFIKSIDQQDVAADLASDALVAIYQSAGEIPKELRPVINSGEPIPRAIASGVTLRINSADDQALSVARSILAPEDLYTKGFRRRRNFRDESLPETILCAQLAKAPKAALKLLPELIEVLESRPPGYISEPDWLGINALHAIAATASESDMGLPVIIEAIGWHGQYLRQAAFDAFLAFNETAAANLTRLLAIANKETERFAFFAVNEFGNNGLSALEEARDDGDPVVRENARRVLAARSGDHLSYLRPQHEPKPPDPSEFRKFLTDLKVDVSDGKDAVRYQSHEFIAPIESHNAFLFAVAEGRPLISRGYSPWESESDAIKLRDALEWLPKNALVVLIARSGAQENGSRRSWRAHFQSALGKFGRSENLDRLPADHTYLLIGAQTGHGVAPVERIFEDKAARFPESTSPQSD